MLKTAVTHYLECKSQRYHRGNVTQGSGEHEGEENSWIDHEGADIPLTSFANCVSEDSLLKTLADRGEPVDTQK